jgi:gliding motility-associated-like protein
MNHTRFTQSIGFIILSILNVQNAFAQFHLNGSAQKIGDRCYRLTDERNNQVGSIWDTTKIDLRQSFEVNLELFFGCKDADGADGIVFGFQPISTSIGQTGEGMGFLGVSPSIGIEMDTYQNTIRNDPAVDHVAIIRNGDVTHSTNNTLAGPIGMTASGNVEDCQQHTVRVVWQADSMKLSVYIDCQFKLGYTGDIVQDIFGGNPFVFWGFTAATGGAVNRQEICFRYTSFIDKPSRVNLCKGDTVQLNASGGLTYAWLPAATLSNPSVANPIAKPDVSTTYRVTITDRCGVTATNEIRLEVNGDPILFDLGADTSLCDGETLRLDVSGKSARTYKWTDGSTDSIRLIRKTGIYNVTLFRGNCSASDSLRVRFIRPPSVFLGVDTQLCFGTRLLLKVFSEEATYKWQDGSTEPTYSVKGKGLYSVEVKNPCGLATDGIIVDFEDCRRLYAPTIFSPNGDKLNDEFKLYSGNNLLKINYLRIFDRWGNLVFSVEYADPNDPSAAWQGDWQGRPLTPDVFVWVAELVFKDGGTAVRVGNVQLIR